MTECVIVALGSNLGDSEKNLSAVIERLAAFAAGDLQASSFFRTAPVDCPPGSPDFLNAVVAFEARDGLTPEALLTELQALEQEFGRQPKKVMNEARPLDLDIVAFGMEVREDPKLTIPHPRAGERRFVLAPLAEILPDFRAPGWSANASEMLRCLPTAR